MYNAFLDFSIFLQNTFTMYKGAKLGSPSNADALPVLMPLSTTEGGQHWAQIFTERKFGESNLGDLCHILPQNTVTNVLALPQRLWLGFSQH